MPYVLIHDYESRDLSRNWFLGEGMCQDKQKFKINQKWQILRLTKTKRYKPLSRHKKDKISSKINKNDRTFCYIHRYGKDTAKRYKKRKL